jgi:hypothetical protein
VIFGQKCGKTAQSQRPYSAVTAIFKRSGMADITREEWLTERLAYFKTPHAPAEHGV